MIWAGQPDDKARQGPLNGPAPKRAEKRQTRRPCSQAPAWLAATRQCGSCEELSPGVVRAADWPLGLALVHAALLIQERPQREILRAGASSIKKLLDVGTCGAPAG